VSVSVLMGVVVVVLMLVSVVVVVLVVVAPGVVVTVLVDTVVVVAVEVGAATVRVLVIVVVAHFPTHTWQAKFFHLLTSLPRTGTKGDYRRPSSINDRSLQPCIEPSSKLRICQCFAYCRRLGLSSRINPEMKSKCCGSLETKLKRAKPPQP